MVSGALGAAWETSQVIRGAEPLPVFWGKGPLGADGAMVLELPG